MKPLLKGLIITLITVAVVIPAGYYAVESFQQVNVAMSQLVPGNSTLVVAGTYNNTPGYIYNSSDAKGVVLGVGLSAFSQQLAVASNTSGGVHPTIEPSLFTTYRGYNIYQVRNVSLEGLIPQNITGLTAKYNLTLNATQYVHNNTLYVADFSSVVTLGSYNSVIASINTYRDKTWFTQFSTTYFNSTANISIYYNSATLPVRQAIINVFYEKTTFNLEFNSTDLSNNVTRGISALNAISTNYTYFYLNPSRGNWVNGTMEVGIGNYYLVRYLLNDLASSNLTKIIPGQIP